MQLHEGFIVGIYNYCDRWCEACELTSRCRVFVDMVRGEAEQDPAMAEIVLAAPLRQEVPSSPPWLKEIITDANDAATAPIAEEALASPLPELPAEHAAMCARAVGYYLWVADWCKQGSEARPHPGDPVSLIAWFASLNLSKIRRALASLAEFDGDREFPPDHEGSAKVALIGLDRSIAAWRQLAEQGRVDSAVASAAAEELQWLAIKLEGAIPYARAFVRPGFDEPEAVRQLLATHAD